MNTRRFVHLIAVCVLMIPLEQAASSDEHYKPHCDHPSHAALGGWDGKAQKESKKAQEECDKHNSENAGHACTVKDDRLE